MTKEKKQLLNNKNLMVCFMPYISILLLFGIWFYGSTLNAEILPSPLTVVKRMMALFVEPINGYNVLGHIWASLMRVIVAMLFATLVGVVLGIMIGWSKILRLTVGTLFEILRPIPPIAWLPLIAMSLGINETSRILLVFIGAVMPVVVNTYTGIKLVDNKILDMGRVFNATNKQLLFEIAIPSAVSYIVAGIKNGIGVAWMVVLAAEMIGADAGVGFLIIRGSSSFDVPLIFVGMLSIGIVGALLSVATDIIERILCPWNRKKAD